MSTLKKPDLSDPKLRAKLAKGMGHNYYGEPAWPNDLLYIFPVVILGTFAILIGLAVLEPSALGEKADPFATPLEIKKSPTAIEPSLSFFAIKANSDSDATTKNAWPNNPCGCAKSVGSVDVIS